MAKATAHPDRRLISSEDVEGTEVYGSGDEVVGEIQPARAPSAWHPWPWQFPVPHAAQPSFG